MQKSRSISTPVTQRSTISNRGIIESLVYLTTSMPYIIFNVCMCDRFQASPREFHFKMIKTVLRYCNETSHHSLWFFNGGECSLVDFFNSDFTSCKSDKKSTSYTVEDDYVVADNYCAKIIWIKHQLLDYDLNSTGSFMSHLHPCQPKISYCLELHLNKMLIHNRVKSPKNLSFIESD